MTSQEYNRLKEYFEQKIASLEKAVTVASTAMERRLEGMNEFRDSLKDQAGRFVTKDEIKSLSEEIKILRDWKNNVQGRTSIAVFLAIAALIVSIIMIFVK